MCQGKLTHFFLTTFIVSFSHVDHPFLIVNRKCILQITAALAETAIIWRAFRDARTGLYSCSIQINQALFNSMLARIIANRADEIKRLSRSVRTPLSKRTFRISLSCPICIGHHLHITYLHSKAHMAFPCTQRVHDHIPVVGPCTQSVHFHTGNGK
jgi:hypothetical protein